MFFVLNIDNYSNNSNAYDSMGDYFSAIDEMDKVAEFFRRAIEIDGNQYSKQKLEGLKNQ